MPGKSLSAARLDSLVHRYSGGHPEVDPAPAATLARVMDAVRSSWAVRRPVECVVVLRVLRLAPSVGCSTRLLLTWALPFKSALCGLLISTPPAPGLACSSPCVLFFQDIEGGLTRKVPSILAGDHGTNHGAPVFDQMRAPVITPAPRPRRLGWPIAIVSRNIVAIVFAGLPSN